MPEPGIGIIVGGRQISSRLLQKTQAIISVAAEFQDLRVSFEQINNGQKPFALQAIPIEVCRP